MMNLLDRFSAVVTRRPATALFVVTAGLAAGIAALADRADNSAFRPAVRRGHRHDHSLRARRRCHRRPADARRLGGCHQWRGQRDESALFCARSDEAQVTASVADPPIAVVTPERSGAEGTRTDVQHQQSASTTPPP